MSKRKTIKAMQTSHDLTANQSGDDDVGYCKPPKHTRFKPRQSGNMKGRPLGARGRKAILQKIANEMHVIVENGKTYRYSTLELIVLFVRSQSHTGKLKAVRAAHKLLAKYGPQEPVRRGGYIITPEPCATVEEWEAKYGAPPPDSAVR